MPVFDLLRNENMDETLPGNGHVGIRYFCGNGLAAALLCGADDPSGAVVALVFARDDQPDLAGRICSFVSIAVFGEKRMEQVE